MARHRQQLHVRHPFDCTDVRPDLSRRRAEAPRTIFQGNRAVEHTALYASGLASLLGDFPDIAMKVR